MPTLIPKKALARKAVKVTAKHSAKGATSKVRRDPARAGSLIGLGLVLGAVAGWLAGRSRTPALPPAGQPGSVPA
jgi:hypothetical protein